MKEKIFKGIFIAGIVFAIGIGSWYLFGTLVRNPDQIIYQTTDSLYVNQYSLYNNDTIVCTYKKPQKFVGVVTKKHKYAQFSIDKGTREIYNTTITYKDKVFISKCPTIYNEYNEGDSVTFEESWYPIHTLKILY